MDARRDVRRDRCVRTHGRARRGRERPAALETLAARRGHDLASAGVAIVAMGGSKNIRYAVDRFGPAGLGLGMAGLVDVPEEGDYRRALERAGLRLGPTRADLERLGFFVCEADLEDELIQALGPARVEAILEARGDLSTFRTLQRQLAQRGRPIEAQLRRFMGTRSGRKEAYAALPRRGPRSLGYAAAARPRAPARDPDRRRRLTPDGARAPATGPACLIHAPPL